MEVYKTKGTCSKSIHFEIEEDFVTDVEFVSGCPGNLLGIKALVKGRPVDEIIEKFEGITCGMKTTSCPDQLATALKEWKSSSK